MSSELTKTMRVTVTFTDRKCTAEDWAQEKILGPFAHGVTTEADRHGRLVLVDTATSSPIALLDEDGHWQLADETAWYGRAFIQGV